MRFIVMHKVDAHMEAGGPPNPRIISEMGALVQGSLKEGVFLNGAGLHRSAQRVRLRSKGGETTTTEGPYAGENELIASFTMISAKSKQAAVKHARKLADSDKKPAAIIDELFLASLSRRPTDAERAKFLEAFGDGDRRVIVEDAIWVILNSKEFLYNR